MENTDYLNGESRLCNGLFRRCRRRQQPVCRPTYQAQPAKQPEVKKAPAPEPKEKKEKAKEKFDSESLKKEVSALWDRAREAKEHVTGIKGKYAMLLEDYGAERLGDLVKTKETHAKDMGVLNGKYETHVDKYYEAWGAQDARNVKAEVKLMTKIFEQYYSFSKNLERGMREFEDTLPELEEVERDIEKLGEPGKTEKQQVVDPLPTKEDLQEKFDEKKEEEKKLAENKLKSINELRDYRHDLKTRLREVQRRGEDSEALEALNAAAHQNSPWETKRKIIIFKSKVQRGTYDLAEHEMKALNHVINKIRYITPEETTYPE